MGSQGYDWSETFSGAAIDAAVDASQTPLRGSVLWLIFAGERHVFGMQGPARSPRNRWL